MSDATSKRKTRVINLINELQFDVYSQIKAMVENHFCIKLSSIVFNAELEKAQNKLAWIISREGDSNGERNKLYYLTQLVIETIKSDFLTLQCLNKI